MRSASFLYHISIFSILFVNYLKVSVANEANSVLFGCKETAGYAIFTKNEQAGILYLMLEPKWQTEWLLPKDCLRPGENVTAAARRALKVTTELTDNDIKEVVQEPIKLDDTSSYLVAALNEQHTPINVPPRYSDYKWCNMEEVEIFSDEPTIGAVKKVNNYLLNSGY